MRGGHDARQESQALGEAEILLDHRRDVSTGQSEVVRADDRPANVPVPVGAAAPHEAVPQQSHCPAFGEAKQRLPGLGRVAPAGGPAAGCHGSGLLVQRTRRPLPAAALWTPRGPFSFPGLRPPEVPKGGPDGWVPGGRGSPRSSPHSLPESSWPQAVVYKFRADLAEVGGKEARTGSGGCHSYRGGPLLPRFIPPAFSRSVSTRPGKSNEEVLTHWAPTDSQTL